MEGRIERERSVRIIGNGERVPPLGNGTKLEELPLLTDPRTFRVELVEEKITLTELQPGVDKTISSPE